MLRVADTVRARTAHSLMRQGLTKARPSASLDRALAACGAVEFGLTQPEDSIRRAAASLAYRVPSPEHAAAIAKALRGAPESRLTIVPSAGSLRQLVELARDTETDQGVYELLGVMINAGRRGTLDPENVVALAGSLLLPISSIGAIRSTRDREELRSAVRSATGPVGVLAAVRLHQIRGLREATSARLKQAVTQAEAGHLLALAHLATTASRQLAFAEANPLHQHGYRRSDALAVRMGCVRLLGARVGDALSRRRAAAGAIADPEPRVRAALVRYAPPSVLADLCFETNARVALSAAIRRSEVGLESPGTRTASEATRRLLTNLTRSPHRAVRSIAMTDAERFGMTHPHSNPTPTTALSLRRRMARGVIDALRPTRDAILGSDPVAATSAILLARRAGQQHTLAAELVEAVRLHAAGEKPEDHRVTATAIAALAGVKGTLARRALEIGLRHPDARVRANAVESVSRDRETAARTIEQLKLDPHHRVRANVYRGLARNSWTQSAATEGMLEMLDAKDQLPQLAALWAIERTALEIKPIDSPAWRAIAQRVASLAIDLTDARVQVRAQRDATVLARTLGVPAAA